MALEDVEKFRVEARVAEEKFYVSAAELGSVRRLLETCDVARLRAFQAWNRTVGELESTHELLVASTQKVADLNAEGQSTLGEACIDTTITVRDVATKENAS